MIPHLIEIVKTCVKFGNARLKNPPMQLFPQHGYNIKSGKIPLSNRRMLKDLCGYGRLARSIRNLNRNAVLNEKTRFRTSSGECRNITLVRIFRIAPTKHDKNEAYSILNDSTIESLCDCLNTLSDFNITASGQQYTNCLRSKMTDRLCT